MNGSRRLRWLPALVLAGATAAAAGAPGSLSGQGTRLLRQPTVSATHIAFAHGADLWIAERGGGTARRLTSTPAVEEDPHLSPDGRWVAFTSNRSGTAAVYVVAATGGDPTRLTWHPAGARARGWTPDGSRVLYASDRDSPPAGAERLWTVSVHGGPSELLPAPWAFSGSYAPDGRRIVVDRMGRWDVEFRGYRGGQNTPLVILDLGSLVETKLPNERTTDTEPVWVGETIYFLSDRDWAVNVWSYDSRAGSVAQVTRFTDVDVKSLAAGPDGALVIEQDGWLHELDPATGRTHKLSVDVIGDFPWAQPRWVDVSRSVRSVSLSATGVRALMEARGEVFTVPTENGDPRNLTRTSDAAERAPVWSPDGARVAWFSDEGGAYALQIAPQDGLGEVRTLSIGESRMAWTPAWSPDGERLAFVDHVARIRVVEVESGEITTADTDGSASGRTEVRPVWSPDSRWLAYSKSFPNNLRRIVVWSRESGETHELTDPMASAISPSWDRGGRYLYFLASTDLGLASSWPNTSALQDPASYGAYVAVLRADDPTPFPHRSDEEEVGQEEDEAPDDATEDDNDDDGAPFERGGNNEAQQSDVVRIDMERMDRRILALPMPVRPYTATHAGAEGEVFVTAIAQGSPGLTVHKFALEEREADVFVRGASGVALSADGRKLIYRSGQSWRVVDTARPPNGDDGELDLELRAWIEPALEWRQMYEDAWRQQRDFFYDPGMHGNDWNATRERYLPLVEHVRHRADLNYVLDLVSGELSVGHSFVRGGAYPDVDTVRVGLLGADLEADRGRWRIRRIFTSESWNPTLVAPLDQPGMRVEPGDYLLAVDGVELTASDEPYRLLDGTAGRQTQLRVGDGPSMEGSWTVTVEPVRSENGLRQRAWVEDNRRRVDQLSDGRLAYAWIPNTGGGGVGSFNRYVFAQQDKQGLVIDERFNGGGLLDDYMVDLMTRSPRAAITNEAGGPPLQLPAGVLGPKVLIINELAGSGGDYFPWVFRQQNAGPLVGMRTWGGLVASCVHYPLVDGGTVTAPCSAVFEPGGSWIAENEGVPPDIEVWMDARSVAEGRDPQLERAVEEALTLLDAQGAREIEPPPFPRPSRRPGAR
ncbi:MAG TPA: PDZ domain-containing protein [Longimicrobiales bacterium]|nr:PDZ domain-containing protein [Longimicrobiales bacterium]